MHLWQNFHSSWLMQPIKEFLRWCPPFARRVTRVEYESECSWQEIKMPMRSSCVPFPPVWHTLSTPMSVSKHSISLHPARERSKKIFIKTFSYRRKVWKLPCLSHPYSCLDCEALTFRGVCLPNMWYEYLLEHMLFANDSEFDQEIVYPKSSQSQILRDFCHWACSLDMNLVYGSLVMHWEYEIWLSAWGKCF